MSIVGSLETDTGVKKVDGDQLAWNPPSKTPSPSGCRKRKRPEEEEEDNTWAPFVIEGLFGDSDLRDHTTLIPRHLLHRACLPLAYLNVGRADEDISLPALFTAKLNALASTRIGSSWQQLVLIAECAGRHELYVIEEIQDSCYALCPLASWVTLSHIKSLGTKIKSASFWENQPQEKTLNCDENSWWHAAALTEAEHVSAVREGGRSARETSPDNCATGAGPCRNSSPPVSYSGRPTSSKEHESLASRASVDKQVRSSEEALTHVRSQYQDALYASRAPLAYFAKGPLSRARASVQRSDGSVGDSSHLIMFLRSLILALPLLDKKYKETLPSIIKGLPFNLTADDHDPSLLAPKPKARKSKKVKIGKDGLYPCEEVAVARWWMSKDISSIPCDTDEAREHCTQALLIEQRSRETQLQIIVILETLALEAVTTRGVKAADSQPAVAEAERQTPMKPKRLQNLNTLLDLLVDRLGIWQSMATEDIKSTKEKNEAMSQALHRQTIQAPTPNHLQQFCVDVVIPFFGARLPDKTALLCRKLGISADPSPRRPPLTKSSSMNHGSAQTGTARNRPQPRDAPKNLKRVSTDERPSHRRRVATLSRSVTEPMLPHLKREVSDVSLSSIPASKTAALKRYSQREVDLRSQSQATASKLKKKAEIEHETQDAIAAMRRPNRDMTVKPYADAAYRREAGSLSRKPRNPVRKPLAPLVMATPRKDHKGLSLHHIPQQHPRRIPGRQALNEKSPSCASKVPCTSTKALRACKVSAGSERSTDARHAVAVEQTPTRGPSKLMGRPNSSSGVPKPSGTILEILEHKAVSPQLPGFPAAVFGTPAKTFLISETPIKPGVGIEAISVGIPSELRPISDEKPGHVQVSPKRFWQQAVCDYDLDEVDLL
ncbi:uncharacterized protein KY384_002080 [Bacidia gigantensis]|uniref:uncharacterized protein n=1 Tax=Bacidia gigantensis TaxID=2732470 RepID=UPI001D0577D2|nr:uncharacterized protein KY384_002080 [Bacidia gigantensis]KAG8533297.1 hypothetical protein KY384_002080 [Bacidia gigantensis]